MNVFILRNRFKYEDTDEIVGVFDSYDKVKQAKLDYMALMPTLPEDTFRFSVEEFPLNKVV